ncbi:MAG: helix-turn-helix domain-containing protein [Acidobacteriota bacterium]|jgi:excisionase family DNA binding protein
MQQQMKHGDAPAAMTAEQALALLGGVISRASFYAAIRRGEVPHRRLGKRIIIPRHAFLRWLEAAQA